MAERIRPDGKHPESRSRRQELVRPVVRHREFATREAQQVLQRKERRRWAPLAYGLFLVVALVIFGTTYTTYAFSKYRGVILPGVHVDQISLAGMTPGGAKGVITDRLAAIYGVPITLTFENHSWHPRKQEIGLRYEVDATVNHAMAVGRQGSFVSNLFDRLPIHPDHAVPLLYTPPNRAMLDKFVRSIALTPGLQSKAVNANLTFRNNHVVLVPSRPGQRLDVPGTERVILSALGSLSVETRVIPVIPIPPVITDKYAASVQTQVERFLSRPPVIGLGKHVIPLTRAIVAPMFAFQAQPAVGPHTATIQLNVNTAAVATYIAQLASQVDRPARNPLATFKDGKVTLVRPRATGRTLDQTAATAKLLQALHRLKPGARLRLTVAVTQPSVDFTNAASLGITTRLATGETSFPGAGETRLTDIMQVAGALNNVLIKPDEDISFNQLVGTLWPARMYVDQEQESQGRLVPGPGGAVQQVATTFLRALYAAGLKLEIRFSHPYRLPWYEPPAGFDAFVTPNGDDLVFHNDTGRYLLLQTRVEPIRQEVYIYVYGPQLRWQVSFDKLGKILKVIPNGPPLVETDTSLAPGERKQVAFAHPGAEVVVERTITRPNGTVSVQELRTHYQPWRAIIKVGPGPTATPTPGATGTPGPRTRARETPGTPNPTPTPTFSH